MLRSPHLVEMVGLAALFANAIPTWFGLTADGMLKKARPTGHLFWYKHSKRRKEKGVTLSRKLITTCHHDMPASLRHVIVLFKIAFCSIVMCSAAKFLPFLWMGKIWLWSRLGSRTWRSMASLCHNSGEGRGVALYLQLCGVGAHSFLFAWVLGFQSLPASLWRQLGCKRRYPSQSIFVQEIKIENKNLEWGILFSNAMWIYIWNLCFISQQSAGKAAQDTIKVSSVQSLYWLGCQGGLTWETIHQKSSSSLFFLREAIVSSSGTGRGIHCLILSMQHFLCQPRHHPPSRVLCRMVLERLSWCMSKCHS